MTTAELIEEAKAKVTAAMVLIEEARQTMVHQPTDEPTADNLAWCERFNTRSGTAYYELYRIVR